MLQRHLTGMEEREKVETFTTTCVEVKNVKVVTCNQVNLKILKITWNFWNFHNFYKKNWGSSLNFEKIKKYFVFSKNRLFLIWQKPKLWKIFKKKKYSFCFKFSRIFRYINDISMKNRKKSRKFEFKIIFVKSKNLFFFIS